MDFDSGDSDNGPNRENKESNGNLCCCLDLIRSIRNGSTKTATKSFDRFPINPSFPCSDRSLWILYTDILIHIQNRDKISSCHRARTYRIGKEVLNNLYNYRNIIWYLCINSTGNNYSYRNDNCSGF